jgi:L-ascorbate metabolism protein UlaG (beta-lactamase superfamily)
VHWILGLLGALLGMALLPVAWVAYQYHRYRRNVPRPPSKVPANRLDLSRLSDEGLSICWVGHATLYIRWNGVGILTDPVFSERVGVKFLGWTIGVRRHTAPAVDIEAIRGKVDLILLSHAHMDHFDLPSLRKLAHPEVEVVTAVGTSRLLKGMRFGAVHELGGRDRLQTRSGITVTAVPVRHWGARFPWNKDYQWTGYLLEYQGKRVFFAGDTAYTPSLKGICAASGADVACLPIGAYKPDSFQRSHCTPEQAWQMFLDTGARFMVPMHWDTFVLSEEPVEEPLERLLKAAGTDAGRIVIRSHGEVFQVQSERVIV